MSVAALVCERPGPQHALVVGDVGAEDNAKPRADEVVIDVLATSVNPIDVKRASGYGARLFAVLGAKGPRVVLGNDFAGRVVALGPDVPSRRLGDLVYGVLPAGRLGAHRARLVAPGRLVRRLPPGVSPDQAAVLPYTFCTLWQALRGAGLNEQTARGRRVLVQGGSSALGQLAIQLLTVWGAQVTVVGSAAQSARYLALGAAAVVDRHSQRVNSLPPMFDATLNFGSWDDESQLIDRLKPDALGHATTVHPLLTEIDRRGWLLGLWRNLGLWWRMRSMVRARAPGASYAWTVFQPSTEALDALNGLLATGRIRLEVGLTVSLAQASRAFDFVAQGQPTRAVIRPLS